MGFTKIRTDELKKIQKDIALIKEILFYNKLIKDPEGELSEQTKKELKEARKTPKEEYIGSEEIKKEFL